MTPAQIAASLTPAQVRALKARADDRFLAGIHPMTHKVLTQAGLLEFGRLTLEGRAVLAELEKRHD